MKLIVERRRQRMPAMALQPGITGMADDREQPGAALSAMKPVKKGQGPHIRLLHDIFRIMIIPRQPARHIVGRREMRYEGLFKAYKCVVRWHTRGSHDWNGAMHQLVTHGRPRCRRHVVQETPIPRPR